MLNLECWKTALDCLAPFPATITRVLRVLEKPNVDISAVEQVIRPDAMLVSRVLRVANSPFYGLSRQVGSIKDACMILGLPNLRNLVIALGVADQFPAARSAVLDRAALWRHGAQVAALSHLLAQRTRQHRDDAYVAGLLHDIGMMVLDAHFPDQLRQVLEHCKQTGGTRVQAELDILGITHAAVGALAAEQWRLPTATQSAIKQHHAPDSALADLVHAANVLCRGLEAEDDTDALWDRIAPDCAQRVFGSSETFASGLDELRACYADAGRLDGR